MVHRGPPVDEQMDVRTDDRDARGALPATDV
jgi:hypothetical protein